MKLTDFLQDVGRPIAYYPSLRRITGSTNATIFLCQLIYWKGKEADPEGWIYKESDEIEGETGLSYGEQKTARRLLVDAGLIEEHYARLDHRMKFRPNLDTINDKWRTGDTAIPESGKPQFGNEQKALSLNESENTTETTIAKPAKKTDELQGGYDLLDGILKYSAPEQEKEKLATDAFESAFGITRPWDWYPSKTTAEKVWRDFRKYLVQLYEKDIYCFEKYATWSRQPYSRGAMTALGIKRNPQDFPDSWAAFCASEMYRPAAEKIEQEKGKGFYA